MHSFDEELRRQNNRDYDLAEIARICLSGKNGIRAATQVSQDLAKAIMERRVFASDYPELLDSLAQAQPRVFLDVFLGGNYIQDNQRRRMFSYDFESRGNPLDQIPDDELLSWCDDDPAVRYPIVAAAIQPFTKSAQTGKFEWRSIVYDHLRESTRFGPYPGTSCSCDRAEVMEWLASGYPAESGCTVSRTLQT